MIGVSSLFWCFAFQWRGRSSGRAEVAVGYCAHPQGLSVEAQMGLWAQHNNATRAGAFSEQRTLLAPHTSGPMDARAPVSGFEFTSKDDTLQGGIKQKTLLG